MGSVPMLSFQRRANWATGLIGATVALAAIILAPDAGGTRDALALTNCTVSAVDLALDAQELDFLSRINTYRAANGAGPLVTTTSLTRASAWMANDLGVKAYFSHDEPSGRAWSTRLTDCDHPTGGWRGENVAAGTFWDTAASAFTAWQNSPGHNANMLNPNYTRIGIGRKFTAGSPYGWYWVTDFGTKDDAGAPPPTSTPVPPTNTSVPPTRTPVPPTDTPVPPTPTNTPASQPPVLALLSPGSAIAGSPSISIVAEGSGFVPGAQVRWNGSVRSTTYVSPTRLSMSLTAADIASAGDFPVDVALLSGLSSAPMTFAVNLPPAALGVGASGIVWGFEALPAVAMASTLPPSVTAVFVWDNNLQAFRFWFRGFPASMNTLSSIEPGMFALFQSTAAASISGPRADGFVLPNPGGSFVTYFGTTGAIWAGSAAGVSNVQLASLLPAEVSAVFEWDSPSQSFQFWFRGFPPGMNTLAAGLQRGRYYFFQGGSPGTTVPMN